MTFQTRLSDFLVEFFLLLTAFGFPVIGVLSALALGHRASKIVSPTGQRRFMVMALWVQFIYMLLLLVGTLFFY